MAVEPNATETQTCIYCGKPYRGENTAPWPEGYGVYRERPCHSHCERQLRAEYRAEARDQL